MESWMYGRATADSAPQILPFAQDWTNIGLLTTNDNWSGVPGIEGFRGDNLTPGTGTDPQTILDGDAAPVLDVNANQTNPETFTTGGVTEFHLANPVVALTGSAGGKIAGVLDEFDIHLCAPSDRTARIQEVHLLTLHCLCDGIDEALLGAA